ncbi:MAG: ComF family protein [Kiritimatiellia bacterium]
MGDGGQGGWRNGAAVWGRTALDLLFPRRCAACEGPVEGQEGCVCGNCLLDLVPVSDPFCARCGDPIDGVAGKIFTCSLCVKSEPAFDLARSALRYRGPLKRILRRFKYSDGTYLARDLSLALGLCVETHYEPAQIDMIAYVPLYHRRERERSYNQARLLAEGMGRRYGKPVLRGLKRVRDTGTQTRLHMAARAENVKGAFLVTEPAWVSGKTFLLVDDVMTTGATLREVAAALKAAGAWRVLVSTVARG